MESSAAAHDSKRSLFGAILRVTSGNFLEQYDFFLFGIYAPIISKTFFPDGDAFISLIKTLAVFAVGFFMRPLGALILGPYVDRVGRRRGLILTLSIMAFGTACIAFVPGYATIGLLAPILVVVGRLAQGFSAGVELGGVSVYLSEIAQPGRRGFVTSWQSASQQISIVVAAALGYAINEWMTKDQVASYGWRIPFFVGCMIVPIIFVLRRSMEETEAFRKRPHRPGFTEIWASILKNINLVVAGTLLVAMTTCSFYLITVYTPSFGRELNLSASDALAVAFFTGLSNFIWLPIGGALADRIGRRPILIATTVLAILTAYLSLSWLAAAPSFSRMLTVLLWLSCIYGLYNGAMVVYLTEVMPATVRVAGFSLAYSLATAVFGGSTPLISETLIKTFNDKGAPGYWLTFAAACGLGATLYLFSRPQPPDEGST